MKIQRIEFASPIQETDPENDNIDVHVYLDDGRVYSFLVATPNNIFWCMENDGTDYFFGFPPPVFVNRVTSENVERALRALLSENKEKWLAVYGVLQLEPIKR
jgi:hypothetical protein